jgi:hydrogenase-4 component E
MSALSDFMLILTILLSLFALGTSRVGMTIRIFAAQSAVVAFLPWLARGGAPGFHQIFVLVATLLIKAILIPGYLFRTLRRLMIHRDIEPLIGYGTSLFAGAALVALAFAIAAGLPLPTGAPSRLLVPASLSALLLGFLLIVSRTKAVSQVVGYLIAENGIFLFGVSLLHEMPLLVEMGILLDIFVAVFVMGIVIFRITREFDHMDTHNLTSLRD